MDVQVHIAGVDKLNEAVCALEDALTAVRQAARQVDIATSELGMEISQPAEEPPTDS